MYLDIIAVKSWPPPAKTRVATAPSQYAKPVQKAAYARTSIHPMTKISCRCIERLFRFCVSAGMVVSFLGEAANAALERLTARVLAYFTHAKAWTESLMNCCSGIDQQTIHFFGYNQHQPDGTLSSKPAFAYLVCYDLRYCCHCSAGH